MVPGTHELRISIKILFIIKFNDKQREQIHKNMKKKNLVMKIDLYDIYRYISTNKNPWSQIEVIMWRTCYTLDLRQNDDFLLRIKIL